LYLGVEQGVLRYWTEDGNLVLTPAEAAQQAVSVAQEAQSRAEQAELRAEQLAQQLRSLGIEPE
jgi:prophage tail gpP-like protein